jgi:uncharacterized protein (TIGR03435 family)
MICSAVLGRRLWIGGAAWVVVAAAMMLGLGSAPVGAQTGQGAPAGAVPIHNMAADADPVFEVATIKPSEPNDPTDGFHTRGRHVFIENQTVNKLIAFAYGMYGKQIAGGPAWLGTDRFDIDGVPDAEGTPSLKQEQGMVKRLLAERFKLTFHQEKRELSVYAITVGKSGPKLAKSVGDLIGMPSQDADQHGTELDMRFKNMSMADFALCMQFFVDRPIVDQTGLEGRWDFMLKWTPDESQFTAIGARIAPPSNDPNAAPGLFTAIQEQIGLKLVAVKALADVIVIDHVERPSAN